MESYTGNKQQSAFQGFLDWLQDIKIFGLGKMVSTNVTTVKVEQFSISFSGIY